MYPSACINCNLCYDAISMHHVVLFYIGKKFMAIKNLFIRTNSNMVLIKELRLYHRFLIEVYYSIITCKYNFKEWA